MPEEKKKNLMSWKIFTDRVPAKERGEREEKKKSLIMPLWENRGRRGGLCLV